MAARDIGGKHKAMEAGSSASSKTDIIEATSSLSLDQISREDIGKHECIY